MKYVDGYVLPVPKNKVSAYRRMALQGKKIWQKHGALEYYECVGDDLDSKWAMVKFPKALKAKPGETIVFSFIVFRSRAHRDRVNAKVMNDPMMKQSAESMPFDMKRMAYGGFKVIVGS